MSSGTRFAADLGPAAILKSYVDCCEHVMSVLTSFLSLTIRNTLTRAGSHLTTIMQKRTDYIALAAHDQPSHNVRAVDLPKPCHDLDATTCS